MQLLLERFGRTREVREGFVEEIPTELWIGRTNRCQLGKEGREECSRKREEQEVGGPGLAGA